MRSNTIKTKRLAELGYSLSTIYAAQLPGEDFAPQYKKNRALFRKVITREIALRRAVRSWQIAFKREVPGYIDWNAYRAGDIKRLLINDGRWELKIGELRALLLTQLSKAIDLGLQYGLNQTKKQEDVSAADPIAQKKLFKRADAAARSVVDTMKDRLIAKLTTAIKARTITAAEFPIDLEEDEDALLIEDVTDDPSKGDTIASTELVAAISIGILVYADAAGIKRKVWRTQNDDAVDETCADLEGEDVPINGTFNSDVGEIDAPPDPHPNCRCFLEIE